MTEFTDEATLLAELKEKVQQENLNSEMFQFSEMAYVRFLRGRKNVVENAFRGMVIQY